MLPQDCNPNMLLQNIAVDEDFHYSQVEGHREKSKSAAVYTSLSSTQANQSHTSTSSSNNNNMRTLQQLWAGAGAQNSAASKSNYGDINDDDIDDDFLVQSIVSKPSDPLVSTSRAVLNTAGTHVDNTIDITASPPEHYHHLTQDCIYSDPHAEEPVQQNDDGYDNDSYFHESADLNSQDRMNSRYVDMDIIPSEVQEMYNCKFMNEEYLKLKAQLNKLRDERTQNTANCPYKRTMKVSLVSPFSSTAAIDRIRARGIEVILLLE